MLAAGALTLSLILCFPGLTRAASPIPGDVVALQAALGDWGWTVPWTGQLASETTAAIASMQREALLPPSGGLDAATMERLGLATGGPVMQLGAAGPDVAALQRALTRAGYGVKPTGLVGPQTESMIRTFQHDHGLQPTGTITLYDLESLLDKTGREAVVATAVQQLGDPYTWGGTGPSGFDCSGLVSYIFARDGLDLPHSTYSQWTDGAAVGPGSLQPGDLVFFTTYASGPSHVGIYVGDGYFVHAADYQTGVTISSLKNGYYFSRYIGAVDPFAKVSSGA